MKPSYFFLFAATLCWFFAGLDFATGQVALGIFQVVWGAIGYGLYGLNYWQERKRAITRD